MLASGLIGEARGPKGEVGTGVTAEGLEPSGAE